MYANTTGRPIVVALTGSYGNYSSGFIATVAGVEVFRNIANDTDSGSTAGGTFIVPSGATYSVVAAGAYAGSNVIGKWMELR